MTLDLRPLTIGELFDRAFMLYRRHFTLFVGVTAVPGLIALLLALAQVVIQRLALPVAGASGAMADAADPAAVFTSVALILSIAAGMFAMAILYWIVYMIALGATTFAVSEIYVGRPVTIPMVYGRMRGRIGALIVLLLLTGIRVGAVAMAGGFTVVASGVVASLVSPVAGILLAMLFGVTTVGLCIFMMLRYGVAVPALVLEGLPPGKSIERSVELTRGRLGHVLLLVVCATLVTYAALVLLQGPFVGAAWLAGIETTAGFWLTLAGTVSGTIGATLTTPFMIIGLALIYYDARIREEGFDLELTLAALDARDDLARA